MQTASRQYWVKCKTVKDQTDAFVNTRQTSDEKGEVPTRQFDTDRAEKLPERVNCANR